MCLQIIKQIIRMNFLYRRKQKNMKRAEKNYQKYSAIYIHTYICDNENDAEHFLLNNK